MKTRYSKQRELIYNHLKLQCNHPTAELIYADLKTGNPELSLGTVYRNLNFLAENNLIKKLDVGSQSIHFDADMTAHYHFVCTTCHKIYDISANITDEVCKKGQSATNHLIEDASIVFTGICEECQKKNN